MNYFASATDGLDSCQSRPRLLEHWCWRPQVRFAILVWYVMIFVLAGSAALLGILFVWYSMDTAFYVGLQK